MSVFGGGQTNCPDRMCTTTVSRDTIRNGRPVTPDTILHINARDGSAVATPNVEPDRSAMLPGAPVYEIRVRRASARSGETQPTRQILNAQPAPGVSSAPTSGQPAQAGQPATNPSRESLRRGGGISTNPGITFDSEDRRYVNNPSAPAQPTNATAVAPATTPVDSAPPAAVINIAPVAPTESIRGVRPAGETARPAPQAAPPAPATTGIFGRRPTGGETQSPGASGGVSVFGSRSRATQSSPSSGEQRPASPPSTSAPAPPARSEPVVHQRSESGSAPRSPSGINTGGGSSGSVSGGSRGSVGGGGNTGGGGHVGGATRGSSGGAPPSGSPSRR